MSIVSCQFDYPLVVQHLIVSYEQPALIPTDAPLLFGLACPVLVVVALQIAST